MPNSRSAPLDHDVFVREGPQKRFIEPRLLCVLRRGPSHGYELMGEIEKLPFPGPPPDSAAVYRMLRELEKKGLVHSEWKTGNSGPSKRVYQITPQGRRKLNAWVKALKERVKMLNRFVSLCEKEK